MADETTPLNPSSSSAGAGPSQPKAESSMARVLNDVSENFFQPFSQGALRLLPARGEGIRAKSKRGDRLPDSEERPLLTDYHSINDPTIRVRVPKKRATPVKVEPKVWFANERTYISYLSMGVLLSTIATGLLYGANDHPARWFALAYAIIAAATLIYGYVLYQKRLTMIASRYPGSFDVLVGPLLICGSLFVVILANFIFRLAEARKEHEPLGVGASPLSFSYAWRVAGEKNRWHN
ncbi:uncharacterized protein CcaverHIS019_0604580 [Cutaneotrichosporon cavernicola]|uniref:DUF202 domain-containing protein n=1 Tax=Cutaneotrichosporon cavernicola TaxID=279322 RepID=A0AA48L8Q0_9TREE|nr:uncharacterized protein CcaverHIS019_0604580 [Cutaneotrichosporon cavernicola]BEI93999.1 hypothetical protein CcaverHIS019_0604580 [Cutaneotrichosporon cavernicola]BEJ01779.1 hypothetical protein CcaverHIS631_0604610 [Cutaneotrichosporon cavernicola]BEJ09546.1 hypothetical protein CcaverHIS641_0604610 [Cutaneotrichosporon cavernicola]